MKQVLILVAGAAFGGAIGYLGFWWLLRHGFYALVLPGGLLGIGAGAAKNRSLALAILCGVAALTLGLVAEWRSDPNPDPSFLHFLAHVGERTSVTLLLIILGGVIGFWIPFRRIEYSERLRNRGAA